MSLWIFTIGSISSCNIKKRICYTISWNLTFAVNLVILFPLKNPLKSKNQNYTMVWNTMLRYPANFQL